MPAIQEIPPLVTLEEAAQEFDQKGIAFFSGIDSEKVDMLYAAVQKILDCSQKKALAASPYLSRRAWLYVEESRSGVVSDETDREILVFRDYKGDYHPHLGKDDAQIREVLAAVGEDIRSAHQYVDRVMGKIIPQGRMSHVSCYRNQSQDRTWKVEPHNDPHRNLFFKARGEPIELLTEQGWKPVELGPDQGLLVREEIDHRVTNQGAGIRHSMSAAHYNL